MKATARLVVFALAAITASAMAADTKPAGATAAGTGAITHGVAHEPVFALVVHDGDQHGRIRCAVDDRPAAEVLPPQGAGSRGGASAPRGRRPDHQPGPADRGSGPARRGARWPKVQAQLAEYEQRYQGTPSWPKIKAERLPALTRELERQSALERLSAQIRSVSAPDERTARSYYESHPELFTEPEQLRFSVILLKVDPSSRKPVWDKAREEATRHSRTHRAWRGLRGDGASAFVRFERRARRRRRLCASRHAARGPGREARGTDAGAGQRSACGARRVVALLRFVDRKAPRLREFSTRCASAPGNCGRARSPNADGLPSWRPCARRRR